MSNDIEQKRAKKVTETTGGRGSMLCYIFLASPTS